MTARMIVSHIQEMLAKHRDIDGWLFHDFKGRNRTVLDLLGVPQEAFITRRCYFWVPLHGEPVAILHTVDTTMAPYFCGKIIQYSSWRELETILFSLIKKGQTVAMEYWPTELLPSQAILDASTKEWLNRQGVSVVSSWPLLSSLIGHFSPIQKDLYRDAVQVLGKMFERGWQWIEESLHRKEHLTEKDLQDKLAAFIRENGAIFEVPPIVAAGRSSISPHHESDGTLITPNTVVLIDAWCKMNDANAPYADFTQVAFTGKKPPEIVQKVYSIVKEAQQTTIKFIDTCLMNSCVIPGAEADIACRYVIDSRGYGNYFSHRTGHNIYLDVHGPGANLDNYESRDSRHLIQNGCYSIEPGVYLPNNFGIRLECNILLESPTSCTVFEQAPDTIRCV